MAGKNKKADQFALTEAFLRLRSNIEFSDLDEVMQVINVVSTNPDEGKSTVSTNLAMAYAKKYKRVLLIDTDLHNPSVHKMLKTSNSKGLTNLLKEYQKGEALAGSPYVQLFQVEEGRLLHFLPAGTRVPNPLEVLGSKRFALLIEEARKEFNVIIIDCPPYGVVSDSVPVSRICDGTVYVVSAKETNKYAARGAMEDLTRNGGRIIGTVLTKVEDMNSGPYGRYNKYGYGYGYGYGDYADSAENEKTENKS